MFGRIYSFFFPSLPLEFESRYLMAESVYRLDHELSQDRMAAGVVSRLGGAFVVAAWMVRHADVLDSDDAAYICERISKTLEN